MFASDFRQGQLDYQIAQHDMVGQLRAGEAIGAAVSQELAHAKHDGPTIDRLMAAAIGMDLNPAEIFQNVTSYGTELACGMLLGRVSRGTGVRLAPMHVVRIQRCIVQADATDKEPENANDEDRAVQILRDLAVKLRDRSMWQKAFELAQSSPLPFWLRPSTDE